MKIHSVIMTNTENRLFRVSFDDKIVGLFGSTKVGDFKFNYSCTKQGNASNENFIFTVEKPIIEGYQLIYLIARRKYK